MDTLGKFKTNFIKNKNSFKIGFNNRSPLSKLTGKLPSASEITVPKLDPNIGSKMVPDISGELKANEMVASSIAQAGAKIGKAIEERKKRKEEKKKKDEEFKSKLQDISTRNILDLNNLNLLN